MGASREEAYTGGALGRSSGRDFMHVQRIEPAIFPNKGRSLGSLFRNGADQPDKIIVHRAFAVAFADFRFALRMGVVTADDLGPVRARHAKRCEMIGGVDL